MLPIYLSFSDSAKFADIARNIFLGRGYGSDFSFFGGAMTSLTKNIFSASGVLPFTPLSIALSFKLFGVNDFSVIVPSLFYFILTVIFVFLLAQRLYKNYLVSAISALAVGSSQSLINYAIGGASESPFIFEIVSTFYFLTLRKAARHP